MFEPITREKAQGNPRILVCDGHDSHISGNFIAHCMSNNIILLVMPPHSSHLTQPLDVAVFGPLKRAFTVEADKLTRTGIRRIQKTEWVELYRHARTKAMRPAHVLAAWLGAGLIPYNPQKAIGRVPASSIPSTPLLQAATMDGLMDVSLLDSSPPEATTLRLSNAVLRVAVASMEPLTESARRYISRLTETSEQLEAENTILRKEKDDKNTVLQKRQTVKTGKRLILKGVVLVSTDTIRDKIIAAEAETLARGKKKGGKAVKSIVVESDDDEDDYVDESDEVSEESDDMGKCIAVEQL
jgi:hypothetical protein